MLASISLRCCYQTDAKFLPSLSYSDLNLTVQKRACKACNIRTSAASKNATVVSAAHNCTFLKCILSLLGHPTSMRTIIVSPSDRLSSIIVLACPCLVNPDWWIHTARHQKTCSHFLKLTNTSGSGELRVSKCSAEELSYS